MTQCNNTVSFGKITHLSFSDDVIQLCRKTLKLSVFPYFVNRHMSQEKSIRQRDTLKIQYVYDDTAWVRCMNFESCCIYSALSYTDYSINISWFHWGEKAGFVEWQDFPLSINHMLAHVLHTQLQTWTQHICRFDRNSPHFKHTLIPSWSFFFCSNRVSTFWINFKLPTQIFCFLLPFETEKSVEKLSIDRSMVKWPLASPDLHDSVQKLGIDFCVTALEGILLDDGGWNFTGRRFLPLNVDITRRRFIALCWRQDRRIIRPSCVAC